MHIPDGYLDPLSCAITYLLALTFAALSFKRARLEEGERKHLVPVLAAAIFVAQMLNWPIPGGTSLHFLGGALAGILLGPWLGFFTMSLVLLVQTLVFHDGGITTLGANILNMAVVAVLTGYYLYSVLPERFRSARTFLAGWLSVTLAGLACGIELGLSKQFLYGLTVTVPVMAGWHAVLGVIEGVATAAVHSYLATRIPVSTEAR